MNEQSPHERTLYRVMVAGTCVAFGAVAAIIASMNDFVGGNAGFHFSAFTIIAFLLGAGVGWAFWWLIGKWQQSRTGRD
jgi:hypothetical protein